MTMPTPTQEMNDWVFSIYGRHPDDFQPDGRKPDPAAAGFMAAPPDAPTIAPPTRMPGPVEPAPPGGVPRGLAGLAAPEMATAAIVGGGVAALVAGPVMEFQQAARQTEARDRTTAFWDAFKELKRLYPANPLVRDFVAAPGWVPSRTDVAKLQSALARARANPPAAAGQPRSKLQFHDWDAQPAAPNAQRKPDDGAAPSGLQLGAAIVTQTQEEADLAASLRAQGWGARQIQTQLDNLRNKSRSPAAPSDGRNKNLPEALWTDSKRARDIAIRNDPKLQATIASGKISAADVIAHHCLAMQTLRDNPDIAAALARAGWSPDNINNLIALPRDADAQARMAAAMGETRGIHDSGHGDWNETSGIEMQTLILRLEREGLLPGTREYDDAVRRGVETIEKKLCKQTPHGRLTMIEAPERTV